jgi:hypothetical protein
MRNDPRKVAIESTDRPSGMQIIASVRFVRIESIVPVCRNRQSTHDFNECIASFKNASIMQSLDPFSFPKPDTMKKTLLSCAALMLAFATVGCQPADDSSVSTDTTTPAADSNVTATAETPAAMEAPAAEAPAAEAPAAEAPAAEAPAAEAPAAEAPAAEAPAAEAPAAEAPAAEAPAAEAPAAEAPAEKPAE